MEERVTLLPMKLKGPPADHLTKAKHLHDKDLESGAGFVEVPLAIGRK